MREAGHLTVDEFVALLDGQLARERLAEVELHLTTCPSCRNEAIEMRRLVPPRAGGTRRAWQLGAMLLAASVLVSIPLVRVRLDHNTDAERATSPESATPIAIVSPAQDATVRSDSVPFVWASVGGGGRTRYRLTITDASGGALWRAESQDTAIAYTGAPLRPGASYFWFVDALRPDGRARTSGTHRFTTAP